MPEGGSDDPGRHGLSGQSISTRETEWPGHTLRRLRYFKLVAKVSDVVSEHFPNHPDRFGVVKPSIIQVRVG